MHTIRSHATAFVEARKTRKHWKRQLKRMIPSKSMEKVDPAFYRKELVEVNATRKHGLKFANEFRPALIKANKWFAISAGGAGTGFMVRLKTGARRIVEGDAERVEEKMLFGVRLSFGKKTVHINLMQGGKRVFGELKELQRHVQMHHADFVVEEIELQAKRMGYKQVTIIDPKDLEYYKTPFIDVIRHDKIVSTKKLNENIPSEKAEIDRIRKGIEKLYQGVIKNRGYIREGTQYVKIL